MHFVSFIMHGPALAYSNKVRQNTAREEKKRVDRSVRRILYMFKKFGRYFLLYCLDQPLPSGECTHRFILLVKCYLYVLEQGFRNMQPLFF